MLARILSALNLGRDDDLKNQLEAQLFFENNSEKVEKLLAKGIGLNLRDYLGNTLFHRAAWCGNFPVVKALVEQGCDLNDKNEFGDTPLSIVVRMRYYNIIKLLMEAGANINVSDVHANPLINVRVTYPELYPNSVVFLISSAGNPYLRDSQNISETFSQDTKNFLMAVAENPSLCSSKSNEPITFLYHKSDPVIENMLEQKSEIFISGLADNDDTSLT